MGRLGALQVCVYINVGFLLDVSAKHQNLPPENDEVKTTRRLCADHIER